MSDLGELTVIGITGRRPTPRGFEYIVLWRVPTGEVVWATELASVLEEDDPDFWLPLLDEFDEEWPVSSQVIGDWN